MKPIALCLVQMGKKGFELLSSHPNVLPNKLLDELAFKAIPLSGKPGDFSSGTMEELFYSSYVFALPQENVRDNIGAIVAVFDDMVYNLEGIRRVFSCIINELASKSLLKLEIIQEILPNIYDGFVKGAINIKISSIATISINFENWAESEKERDRTNDLEDDLWR